MSFVEELSFAEKSAKLDAPKYVLEGISEINSFLYSNSYLNYLLMGIYFK